ncbi:hypothetical protein E2C01_056077 [Portunus trituberculatus]|uniref:Uncharacterized protein n=1 Tax=Portunus trituberculatus TaxID=210409 RepID=A0A5B7GYN8_PORTR|nr:hypothetical protein [Portunus trituberculatus]
MTYLTRNNQPTRRHRELRCAGSLDLSLSGYQRVMRSIITPTGHWRTRVRLDCTFRHSGSTRDSCDNIIGRLHANTTLITRSPI